MGEYVADEEEFLALRKMPLVPYDYLDQQGDSSLHPATLDPAAEGLLQDMRAIVRTDRELADKVCESFSLWIILIKQGAKAFVSALRAYTKHEASYIFRVANLDFNSLGTAYGLLRLPAMPEVRDWRKKRDAARVKREKAVAGEDVDPVEEIPWTDADIDVSLISRCQIWRLMPSGTPLRIRRNRENRLVRPPLRKRQQERTKREKSRWPSGRNARFKPRCEKRGRRRRRPS